MQLIVRNTSDFIRFLSFLCLLSGGIVDYNSKPFRIKIHIVIDNWPYYNTPLKFTNLNKIPVGNSIAYITIYLQFSSETTFL